VKFLDKPNALKLVTLFSGAVKGMAFYPASHPAIRQPLMELYKLLTTALSMEKQVSWGLIDGFMYFGDHLFIAPSTALADLTNRMIEKEVSRITVGAALTFDELEEFVKLFAARGARFADLSGQMTAAGITGLRLTRQGEESFAPGDDSRGGVGNGAFDGGAAGGQGGQGGGSGSGSGGGLGDGPGGAHLQTYNSALSAIRTICLDIERGRIPNSAQLIQVVDRMVDVTMREPWALLGLTMIKDYDNYTFTHCVNVGVLAMALGSSLGMDAPSVRDLGIAGQLHDIGKTMISKDILNKPGKLSSAEFDEMRRHSELGAKIIGEMEGLGPHIASAVLGHHLHYNRSGYPEWARQLPVDRMMEIIAIADTYDAITTLRVYKHPVSPKAALNEIQSLKNTILDGAAVERFVDMMGAYPVGTLVRLDTNEVAMVSRPNQLEEAAPLVNILIDGDGQRLPEPREQALVMPDGSYYGQIVAVVDPLLKSIDVGKLISSGNY
jgi:HD-GYP domain-containing protein (c-di-GMP phosphodiesterase class II)